MAKEFYKGLGTFESWPTITGSNPMSLSYDDILLAPQQTSISSRSEIDPSVTFGPYTLTLPIISAPMDTITGEKMVREMARLGGIGALPRGNSSTFSEVLATCKRLVKDNVPCLYSVGLKNGMEQAKELVSNGAQMILVDVANGAMQQSKELSSEIKKKLKITVVAGNIATYSEAKDYQKYGIDIAKVGIGPGGMCTTRLIAATGVPQLSAIFDTTSAGNYVIADGGVVYPGDVAKAIAAGASMVMIGSLFGGTDETPGEIDTEGMKTVRGQASFDYMKDNNVKPDEHRTAEGISTRVKAKGPVERIIRQIDGGLRSAMSYAGAKSISEFHEKARFVLASPASQKESQPHILVMD